MCRANAEGGRRCPFHAGTAGREAHNERRKANRALKAEALRQAVDADMPSSLIARIKAAPPGEAKRIGLEYGLLSDPKAAAAAAASAAASRALPPAVPVPEAPPGPQHRLSRPAPRLNANPAGGRRADARHRAPAAVGGGTSPSAAPESTSDLSDEVQSNIGRIIPLQGGHPDEKRLLDNNMQSIDWATGGGVNDTRRVVLSDGSVAFFKSFEGLDTTCASSYGQEDSLQPLHEAAAWQVAKNLGKRFESLVPPCVIREIDGKAGSIAVMAHGTQGPFHRIKDSDVDKGAFFDALIGQQDRHRFNLFTSPGKMTLIDHGFAFAVPGDTLNQSVLVSTRHKAGRSALKAYEKDALKKLLASPDSWGLDGVLATDRLKALRGRAQRMLESGQLLARGDY